MCKRKTYSPQLRPTRGIQLRIDRLTKGKALEVGEIFNIKRQNKSTNRLTERTVALRWKQNNVDAISLVLQTLANYGRRPRILTFLVLNVAAKEKIELSLPCIHTVPSTALSTGEIVKADKLWTLASWRFRGRISSNFKEIWSSSRPIFRAIEVHHWKNLRSAPPSMLPTAE